MTHVLMGKERKREAAHVVGVDQIFPSKTGATGVCGTTRETCSTLAFLALYVKTPTSASATSVVQTTLT